MLSGGKFANGAHATTGTVEGALMGGFTAAVTAGVGHGNAGNSIFGGKVATALGHGVTKGAISEIRGGEFKDGFVGGVVGHVSGYAMGEVGGNGGGAVFGRTAIAAAAGGLTAEATGGSFEDGAFHAAMVHLFNAEAKNIRKIIDSTRSAWNHYMNGNGETVELGPNTKLALRNHSEQRYRSRRIKTGQTSSLSGNYKIDMTTKVFHVGKTRVDYSTTCQNNLCTTTYVGFSRDGFWDANELAPWSHDGMGPGGEFSGGTVYRYAPYQWSETYPSPY